MDWIAEYPELDHRKNSQRGFDPEVYIIATILSACSDGTSLSDAEELGAAKALLKLRPPFSAMLTLVVSGLICGANDVKATWHKYGPLDQNQRRDIGLTKQRKNCAYHRQQWWRLPPWPKRQAV